MVMTLVLALQLTTFEPAYPPGLSLYGSPADGPQYPAGLSLYEDDEQQPSPPSVRSGDDEGDGQ